MVTLELARSSHTFYLHVSPSELGAFMKLAALLHMVILQSRLCGSTNNDVHSVKVDDVGDCQVARLSRERERIVLPPLCSHLPSTGCAIPCDFVKD